MGSESPGLGKGQAVQRANDGGITGLLDPEQQSPGNDEVIL